MEQGAALSIEGDTLSVFPRNDIYVRYLADNRGVVSELAAEFFGRPIRVELATPGAAPPPEPEHVAVPPSAAPDEGGQAAAAGVNGRSQAAAPTLRTAGSSADERAEIYSDPGMRRIFDAFEARLVEVRPARSGKEQE